MNRDRLLADARAFALELADGYAPPEPRELTVAGPSGRAALELAARRRAATVAGERARPLLVGELANVLTGGDADPTAPVPEQHVSRPGARRDRALIRRSRRCSASPTCSTTGKPLRN